MPVAPVSDGHPLLPRIPTSSPSGVNFLTVWSRSSVQYTTSSGPIVIPCGRAKRSFPHEPTNRPSRSKMMRGWSPRLKTKTRSCESVATPATSTKRHPSGRAPQPSRTSKRGPSATVRTDSIPRPPAPWASPGPGDVVAGRVQPDPVEAPIHGDVEHVLLVADAEIDVARVADRLASALLRLAGLDEGHLLAGRIDHEDAGSAGPAGGEVDPALG